MAEGRSPGPNNPTRTRTRPTHPGESLLQQAELGVGGPQGPRRLLPVPSGQKSPAPGARSLSPLRGLSRWGPRGKAPSPCSTLVPRVHLPRGPRPVLACPALWAPEGAWGVCDFGSSSTGLGASVTGGSGSSDRPPVQPPPPADGGERPQGSRPLPTHPLTSLWRPSVPSARRRDAPLPPSSMPGGSPLAHPRVPSSLIRQHPSAGPLRPLTPFAVVREKRVSSRPESGRLWAVPGATSFSEDGAVPQRESPPPRRPGWRALLRALPSARPSCRSRQGEAPQPAGSRPQASLLTVLEAGVQGRVPAEVRCRRIRCLARALPPGSRPLAQPSGHAHGMGPIPQGPSMASAPNRPFPDTRYPHHAAAPGSPVPVSRTPFHTTRDL